MFAIDALRCPRCAKPMTLLALISDPPVVVRILEHLGLPSEPPSLAPARGLERDDPTFDEAVFALDEPVGELDGAVLEDELSVDSSAVPPEDDDTPPP